METEIRTTKSPAVVVQEALLVAGESMPLYSHPFVRKDFTQHQLFAILTLRRTLQTDIHGVIKKLEDSPELSGALGLKEIPDYSTLFHAEQRLIGKGFLETF